MNSQLWSSLTLRCDLNLNCVMEIFWGSKRFVIFGAIAGLFNISSTPWSNPKITQLGVPGIIRSQVQIIRPQIDKAKEKWHLPKSSWGILQFVKAVWGQNQKNMIPDIPEPLFDHNLQLKLLE